MISSPGRAGAHAPGQSRQAVAQAPASRVVHRPLPESQAKNARTYQIEQLRRRYSPRESTAGDGSSLVAFDLKPSDPDFPFDLDHLECELRVPQQYPGEPPALQVRNKDIPRGFGINIERGWDKLVQERRGATLLALTNALDKQLETFLAEQKVETVKLMNFNGLPTSGSSKARPAQTETPVVQPQAPPKPVYVREESYSKEDIAAAKARRAQETRQLEARMGKLALYHRSNDGIVYTLPLEPKRRQELPEGLRSVASVQLIVPLLYPLQQIRILLNDVESFDAEPVEELFADKAQTQKQMSLTSHLNFLAQNLHSLAAQARKAQEIAATSEATPSKTNQTTALEQAAVQMSSLDIDEKSHVHFIQRPPEWSFGEHDTDSSGGTDISDDEDEDEDDGGAVIVPRAAGPSTGGNQVSESGIALSFPSVELYGVELLQVTVLSLSVKCHRCKTTSDVGGLKEGVEKSDSCMKCGTVFTAKFRPQMVHQNSTRAGFIDLTGCTVADLLPSTFTPTCAGCSTPAQPLVSVRGETVTNVCRECHARFTFKLPDVKFLAYSASSSSAALPPATGPRRREEKLGLTAGEPLPARGTCAHYRRSYRWFRFSCCGRVHACDRCHDAAEASHESEWASRMICGFCSREQRYSPEACAFCGRSVIGRRGNGYWEGGRGTRDRVLMRRGDKRKYRRVGGGAVAAEAARRKNG